MEPSPTIAIGTCAWSFEDWRGAFYPRHLPSGDRLEFFSRHFNAVEVDSTFYHTPAPQVAQRWMDRTPGHFFFVCKMPREITHDRKLRDSKAVLREFLDGIAPLRPRLGCVLIQLPPSFRVKEDELALRQFVMELPLDVRFAVEFRSHDWHVPRITRFLEENHVCVVWNDTSPLARQREAPFDFLPQTTDFLYLRLMGDLHTKYRTDGAAEYHYDRMRWPRDEAIEAWAVKLRKHLDGTSRLLLFANNHYEGFAPLTCQRLARHLNIRVPLPEPESIRESKPSAQLDLL